MKMTIRTKLLLTACFFAITMSILGYYSVTEISIVNTAATVITTNYVPGINLANQMNTLASDYRNFEYRHILSTDPAEVQNAIQALNDKENQMKRLMSEYEKGIADEHEKQLYNKVKKSWIEYLNKHEELLLLSRFNDSQGAVSVISKSAEQYNGAKECLNQLVQLNLKMTSDAKQMADREYNQARLTLISVVIGGVAVGAFIMFLIARSILISVRKMQTSLTVLVEKGGDLTQKIEIHTGDEIESLAYSVNLFIENQRNIIAKTLDISSNVSEIAKVMSETVVKLNFDIEDISAATQQLSSSMEETSASAEEMNSITHSFEQVANDIAYKAENGASNSAEISKRAKAVQETAFKSSQLANEICEQSNQKLLKAVEDANAVDSINVLADSILSITSQTNLLALNAAIEAARAGEAGRGFAVVADEIRKLAEESKKSVTQIQKVTQIIIQAVRHLSESSREVLSFVDTQVISDYKQFVDVAEQYTQDAQFVTDMSSDLSSSSEQLLASIQSVVVSVGEISKAAEESAAGSANIAVRSSEIMESAARVAAMSEQSKENSMQLVEIVSKFKI